MTGTNKIIKQDRLNRIAMILVEASLFGDNRAAQNAGLTRATIINYKKKLSSDPELSQIFTLKKQELEDNWVNEVASTLLAGMDYIKRASQVESFFL